MKWRRAATLHGKLTGLSMLCSVLALATTALALGTYEFLYFRRTLYLHLHTISAINARNSSAAVAFADTGDATRILSALDAEPVITAAALYDRRGLKLAEYRRPGLGENSPPDRPPADGTFRFGRRLDIVTPVSEATRFGTLLVRADVSILGERLLAYSLVLIGTTLTSGLLAFLLSGWLSARLVAPVRALVEAATRVRTQGDYRIRVKSTARGELGTLTEAFNDMLGRVEAHERELQRGSERLRLAVEAARIGTWDWNVERNEIGWSERNYEIFGLAPGTCVTPELFFAQIHPDDCAAVRTAVENSVRARCEFATEFRLAGMVATPRHVLVRGMFLPAGVEEVPRGMGVAIDVTERRNAELRLRESERRFRVMAERAPAMLWSCDESLRREYCNRTWLAFTGRPVERELGDGWQEGLPAPDLARWRETVGTAAAQRDPFTVEYRLRRRDGVLRWIIESGSPRFAADGSFGGYLGTCIDITARKENEAELEAHVRARTRELEQANQELETFSYSVSHDLRGPVRAVQGFAEIAAEECRAGRPEIALERLHRVSRAAERMNRLIDAFLSMARVSRAELHPRPVSLTRVAEDVVGFLRSTHPDSTVNVQVESGLECRGDERLLRIALENLIANAWKFSSRTAEPRIEIGSAIVADERTYYVRDNGAGFDPAHAHKLFRAFERLHQGSEFEGLGVGLSTVHRVIEKHGGRIWAEGAPGQGATFFFTISAPVGDLESKAA